MNELASFTLLAKQRQCCKGTGIASTAGVDIAIENKSAANKMANEEVYAYALNGNVYLLFQGPELAQLYICDVYKVIAEVD